MAGRRERSMRGDCPFVQTALSLLDHDFVFSQQTLLNAHEFEGGLKQRGVALWPGHLEAFHRRGVVRPLFRLLLRRTSAPHATWVEAGMTRIVYPRGKRSVPGRC